jgi:hypothetical protein
MLLFWGVLKIFSDYYKYFEKQPGLDCMEYCTFPAVQHHLNTGVFYLSVGLPAGKYLLSKISKGGQGQHSVLASWFFPALGATYKTSYSNCVLHSIRGHSTAQLSTCTS